MKKSKEINKDSWGCDGCANFNPQSAHQCPLMAEGYGENKILCNCCEDCEKECAQSLYIKKYPKIKLHIVN